MRLIQAICSPLAVALTLIFGGQLYAVPVETAAALTVFGIWLLRRYPRVILQLLALPTDPKQPAISWRHEILPMQMRVALFVMSAYFQSYVIVPLLFRFRGPAEAGQMGMSLRLTNSIYAVSVGWINVRAPKMGTLIGGNDMAGARQTAFTAIMRGVLTSGLGIAALFVVIVVAQHYYPAFPTRLLPLTPTMVIAFTVPVSVLLAGLSAYLRSYKIEPFGFPGVLTASINVVICTISAYYGSASVLAYAYAGQILFITLPYYIWIFLRRQREGEAGIRAKLAQAAQPVAGSP